MSKETKADVEAVAPIPVIIPPVPLSTIPLVSGIPTEGRDIGEYAMRPYEVKVAKADGTFVTYKSN